MELPVLIGVMLSRCHSAEVLSTTDGSTLVAVLTDLEVIGILVQTLYAMLSWNYK